LLRKSESRQELTDEDISSRINPTGYRRLRLLPAGAEPHDPADLLARPELESVIEYLRTLADIVVIDSPPAFGMADAPLLAVRADASVVIASVKRTDRVRLVEAVASLRASGANVVGVVANRSRRRLPKSYSAYYLQSQRVRPAEPDTDGRAEGARQSSAHMAIRDANANPVIRDASGGAERKYVSGRLAPRRASYSPASMKLEASPGLGGEDIETLDAFDEEEEDELELDLDAVAAHPAGDGAQVSEDPDVEWPRSDTKSASTAALDAAAKPSAERERS